MNRVHSCGVVIFALAVFAGRDLAQQMAAPAVGADQEMVDETTVPGDIQLIHWDALLNQSGADAFNKVAAPIKTDSKLYQGLSCSGFEMRQSIADAIANNGTASISRNVSFAQTFNGQMIRMQPTFFNYFSQGDPRGVQMNGQSQKPNDTCERTPDGHMHLVLDESGFRISMVEGGRRTGGATQGSTASIKYDGNLGPGDAVAFMAPFTAASKTVYYQLNVWEAFKAPNPMMVLMQNERNSGWWCQNGPAGLRKWAGVAMVWEAQAAHVAEEVPADFIKKLDDGKELRLVALCRPSDAPFCWWDGKGQAVSNLQNAFVNYDGDPPKGLWAMVEVKGDAEEYRRMSPATQPITDRYAYMGGGQSYVQYQANQLADGATEVTAQTAVGPWQEIGQLNLGEQKEIGGIEYSIVRQGTGNGPNFQVMVQYKPVPADLQVSVSPVGSDGKEAYDQMGRQAVLFPGPSAARAMNNYGFFNGMPIGSVQYFRLCTRKLQSVTFTGFATKPQTPVRTDYSADELAAAAKQAQDRADAEQASAIEAQRKQLEVAQKEWDAVVPDVKTPMGALKFMYNAAAKGDEKTFRGMLTSGDAQTTPDYLDKYAHSAALDAANSARARTIFNATQLDELSNHGAYFLDPGATYSRIPWTKKDNGDWEYPGRAMRKSASGDYNMEVSFVRNVSATTESQIMDAQVTLEEAMAAALAQPNVTVAQVESAAVAANKAMGESLQSIYGR